MTSLEGHLLGSPYSHTAPAPSITPPPLPLFSCIASALIRSFSFQKYNFPPSLKSILHPHFLFPFTIIVVAVITSLPISKIAPQSPPSQSLFPEHYAVIVFKVFRFCPIRRMATSASSATTANRPPLRRYPTLSNYVQTPKKLPPDRARFCGFQTDNPLNVALLGAFLTILISLLRLLIWTLEPSVLDLGFLHSLGALITSTLLICSVWFRFALLCLPFLLFNLLTVFLLFHCFFLPLLLLASEWPLLDTLCQAGPLLALSPMDRQLAFVSLTLSLLLLSILSLAILYLCWLELVVLRAFNFLKVSTNDAGQEIYPPVSSANPRIDAKMGYF